MRCTARERWRAAQLHLVDMNPLNAALLANLSTALRFSANTTVHNLALTDRPAVGKSGGSMRVCTGSYGFNTAGNQARRVGGGRNARATRPRRVDRACRVRWTRWVGSATSDSSNRSAAANALACR